MSNNDTNELPYILKDPSEVEKGRILTKENVSVAAGRGDAQTSTANIFSGFNHRNAPLLLPRNDDRVGFTFYTRPDMNFSPDNIKVSRLLLEALRGGGNSYTAAMMCMLDPQCPVASIQRSSTGDSPNSDFMPNAELGRVGGKLLDEIGFDNKCAFIPMLSNLQLSLTGFPDSSLDVYVSEEGLMREQRSYADSTRNCNNSITLSGTYHNIKGDPITTFFNLYTDYIARVKEGTFWPRWNNLLQRRSDYDMRVYRFITDSTGRYVTKFGIANAIYPLNDAMGAFMNVPDRTNGIITDIDQINITFQCDICQYNDPIIKDEFNTTVATFNPDMWPDRSSKVFKPRNPNLIKIEGASKIYANTYGYPHIDIDTNELSWWGYKDDIERLKGRASAVKSR